MFRDRQEKRIPGGVTIAAAGNCYFNRVRVGLVFVLVVSPLLWLLNGR